MQRMPDVRDCGDQSAENSRDVGPWELAERHEASESGNDRQVAMTGPQPADDGSP